MDLTPIQQTLAPIAPALHDDGIDWAREFESIRGDETKWRRLKSLYGRSARWRHKQKLTLERDKVCQNICGRPATQAHHLTYAHLGDEPLWDLVGVCGPCHLKVTAHDRGRRKARFSQRPIGG